MQRRWRLTVECHKLHNGLYFKSPNHETSRATLAPSSLFRVGKILIYANAYHKLHYSSERYQELFPCMWRFGVQLLPESMNELQTNIQYPNGRKY